MVVITGDAKTEPGQLDLDYSWTTDGGTIEGSGNVVSINTTGMAIGDYRVKGHASLASSPSIGRECVAVFRVIPVEVPPASDHDVFINMEKNDKDFHDNVKDAYFGVNSAKITPDTLATIIHAAQYLVAHPAIQVIVSGWADPRGSVDFNLALASETCQCCSRCPDRRRSASKPTRNHQQRQVEPGLHDKGPGMLETESPRLSTKP